MTSKSATHRDGVVYFVSSTLSPSCHHLKISNEDNVFFKLISSQGKILLRSGQPHPYSLCQFVLYLK